MKKKLNYTAPETEQMEILFDQNIMLSSSTDESALKMTSGTFGDGGDWD